MDPLHPMIRLIIIFMLIFLLVAVVSAQSLPEDLANKGIVTRQGSCQYKGEPRYCILVTYQKVAYVAVGFVRQGDFFVQHILSEVNGSMVNVWNHNDVEI